ncbi:MAG: DUF1385 domain-containing protein, partial [Bacillota bacterium]
AVGYQGNVYIFRLISRLALLPVVAGVSYEVLKLLAHSESLFARALRWPGIQLQRLTTKKPDDGMVEVAIVSMNVALHGMPAHAERTPEGWAVLKSYVDSGPAYVPKTEATKEPEGEKEAV